MTLEKAIEMIDEYLLEPHSIDKDWVEVLTLCKKLLIEKGVKPTCGTCVYSAPTTHWNGSPCYVECTNKEHIEKYCRRNEIAKTRQRTNPACKSYVGDVVAIQCAAISDKEEIARLKKENSLLRANMQTMCAALPSIVRAEREAAIKEISEKQI